MKIVDSMPVVVDRRKDGLDVVSGPGRKPRRFRTVSESAVRSPLAPLADPTTSSLCNIAEHSKELKSSVSNNRCSDAAAGLDSSKAKPTHTSEDENAPLTHHQEVNENHDS